MKWTTWKERINLLWTKIFNLMPQFITFSEDCENSKALKYWWIVHREWTQKNWIYFLMAEYFFSFVVYLSPLTMAWSWGVFNFNSWINGKYTRQEKKKKHEHDELRTLGKIFLRGPTTLLSEQRQTYIPPYATHKYTSPVKTHGRIFIWARCRLRKCQVDLPLPQQTAMAIKQNI